MPNKLILQPVLDSQYGGLYKRAKVMRGLENKVLRKDDDIKYILVSSNDDSFGIGDIVEIDPKDFVKWKIDDNKEITGVEYWGYEWSDRKRQFVRHEIVNLDILCLSLINFV